MEVVLVAAGVEEKPRLARLFQLYAYDFSEVTGDAPDREGLFRVPSIEVTWNDARWRGPVQMFQSNP